MADGTTKAGARNKLRAVKTKIDEDSPSHIYGKMRHNPEMIKELFRTGKYPYKTRIRRGVYEQHKKQLQVELLKVQNWVKMTGQKNRRHLRGPRRGRQGRHHQALYGAPEPSRSACCGAGKTDRTRDRAMVLPALR